MQVNLSNMQVNLSNLLLQLTDTFAVKLLPIVVSAVSPKKVLARTILIELAKIIHFSRLNVTKNVNL